MSDEAAFLAAISCAPNDNTVRLVYADWLDEHDRPGSAFLRTECELASLPTGQAQWHEVFAKYQSLCAGIPEKWRNAVRRYPLEHWLTVSARSAWTRLENWFRQHHPRLFDELKPGASAEEIEAVEQHIGKQLPPDVRESFAIHNGAGGDFVLGDDLLTIDSLQDNWAFWRGLESYNEEFRWDMKSFPENAVALNYANPGWIPLTRDAGSNHIGVDLAPEPAGTIGQVIIFGRDENVKCVLASGWAEFLADYATFLESGAVSGFDPYSDDPCSWYAGALKKHCHDELRDWRQEGRWPIRKQA